MKWHIIIFISLVLLTISCSSQHISSANVPSVVLNTLKSKYPVSNDVDWKRHDNFYEAELDLNDTTEVSLRIDEAGKLVMQKQDVSLNELSSAIIMAIQNRYKDRRIDDVEKIEKDGAVYYQVEWKGKGKRDVNVILSADGREEKSISYWD